MVQIGPLDKSSPNVRFYSAVDIIEQSVSGNWSKARYTVTCYNRDNANSETRYLGSGSHSSSIDAIGQAQIHSGNPFLVGGLAAGQLRWSESGDAIIYHDANGYAGPYTTRLGVAYGDVNESHYGTLYIARIAKVPAAPTPVGLDEVTTTTTRYRFSGNSDGGSAILEWQAQADNDPAFGSPITMASSGTGTFTGLIPGTEYSYRSRGRNAVGWGPWSTVISQTTLPSVAPGLSVASTVTGTAALITMTPPGGVTGVTQWRLERRDTGTVPTVYYSTTYPSYTTSAQLTPGKSYDWRATAWIGEYQAPFTDWITVVQNNPNTNPGNFFDGGTADTPVLDYAWVGAAENSQSTATGLHPTGWRTFGESDNSSGGTGAVFRASGGFQGSYAARAVFFTDATAQGFEFGQSEAADMRTDVEPLETYFGSVYAWPSRSQRGRAVLKWWTSAGAFISDTLGDQAVVAAGDFTRMIVSGVAPSNAQWATVVFEDVSGTGWSTWKGGDWLHLDAAMISRGELQPYFDGDTPDTLQFTYSWEGDPNASVSNRSDGVSDTFDPLADPDCDPVPAAPRPPGIIDDCIETTTSWRRYLYTIPSTEVAEWQSTLPTLELTTGIEPERQVRIRIYPNPFDYPTSLIDFSNYCSEQIISYLPPGTRLTIDGELERVFAEVGGGNAIAADHLLYGTGGGPATWPDLSCGISYLLTVDVPPTSTAGNLSADVALIRRA